MKNYLELIENLLSKNFLNLLIFACSLVVIPSNNLNAQCAPTPSAGVYNYKICEGNNIPTFEVDEIITDKTYQLDDGDLEQSYGLGQDSIPFTWGNMFEIKAEDCANGCSFINIEAAFGNAEGELVNWYVYTDDDGDPTSGLSSPLASGNHTVNNNSATTNEALNSIVVNNIDVCATIDTMPFLFIYFSYVGTFFPASIDTTTSNMQSWLTFTGAGMQADWSNASSSLVDETVLPGGNWLIRANLACPPCAINWYDAPAAGNLLGSGNTFELSNQISEEGAAVDSTNIGIYTFYAETQCNTCISNTRRLVSLEVEDCCPAELNLPTGTDLYEICAGDDIPIFELDETYFNGIADSNYQLDDGLPEQSFGTGQDSIPFTWGNMFEIKAENCAFGCLFTNIEASFGNAQGELVTWHIYTDDDGDPTSGLSTALASGNHTVNNVATISGALDSIVVNNIDICTTINTMPYLFISFSYIGAFYPASIDNTTSNMQSWRTFAADGTQADWASASASLIDDTTPGGNWIIRANSSCPPCTIKWYDAPTAGNLLGSGNTFEASMQVSEEGAAVDSTNIGTYTFYAETECNTCISNTRKSISLEVEDCCPAVLNLPTGIDLYEICAGDDIPIFELDETYLNEIANSNYQLDDGILESFYGTGQDSIPFTWGNMFEIKLEDCVSGCSFISLEAAFGNTIPMEESVSWYIYTDDDGDPTSGLSSPLASGNHTIVNNGGILNGVLDSIVVNNIDICATINTMPYMFISFSYLGASYPASIDNNSTSNMQSWRTFTANGTQADWASTSASLIDDSSLPAGNWLIRANLTCPPCAINWYDAPAAGNLLGSGNTFELSNQISEEGAAVDSTHIGIYTFYAETECNTCISNTRRLVSLEVEDCCPAELNFPSTVTHNMDEIFEAGSQITSAAVVDSSVNVTYLANHIRINSGFKVPTNATFHAGIGGCDP